jgi:ApaG protein
LRESVSPRDSPLMEQRQRESSFRQKPGGLLLYERTTRGIRVQVRPSFLDDQSDPESGRYLWSYTVTIENKGGERVQLMSRYWHITDAVGHIQEVRGPGVVGAQPVIEPGESFEYTSGCPLQTASGAMAGRYQMKAASGEAFEAEIPAFLLESPHERRQIH